MIIGQGMTSGFHYIFHQINNNKKSLPTFVALTSDEMWLSLQKYYT